MKLVNPNETILATCKGYKTVTINGEEVKRNEKIILTDERMYFLVDELGKVCKYVENKVIDRAFFGPQAQALMLEVEDCLYPFEIVAQEADLRALCKAFKEMKKNRCLVTKRDLFYHSSIVTVLQDEEKMKAFVESQEKLEDVPEDKPKHYSAISDIAASMGSVNDIVRESQEELAKLQPTTPVKEVSSLPETKTEVAEEKEETLEGTLKILEPEPLEVEAQETIFENKEVEKPKKKFHLFSRKER